MELREEISAAVENTPVESPAPAPVASAPVALAPSPAPVAKSPASDDPTPVGEDSASDAPAPASKAKSVEEVVAKAADEHAAKPAPVADEGKPQSDPRVDRAPASWKGDAKKVWEGLPLQARQEVIRRERDTLRVLQENAGLKNKVDPIQRIVDQNREVIQKFYGGDPVAALNNMMVVDRNLTSGTPQSKAEFVARIINNFGIDIEVLDAVLSKSPIPHSAAQQSGVEELINQRLAPVMDFVQERRRAEQQAVQQADQRAAQTVEQMASDPSYPYFEDVRDEMADLIEISSRRGATLSLHDAYEKATRLNDSTFQASSVRNQTESDTQRALSAHQEAQAAKGASVSITGNPNGAGNGLKANPADLRSVIASQFGEGGARV